MNLSDLLPLIDHRIISLLFELDAAIAEATRLEGCPYCRGVLHRADYPRRPRGIEAVTRNMKRRRSFCCAECRRRVTPASMRFLGRKVYWAILVILAEILRERAVTEERVRGFCRTGVSTVGRWVKWWHGPVKRSRWWAEARARLREQPGSFIYGVYRQILERAAGAGAALGKLILFISPLSVPANYPS